MNDASDNIGQPPGFVLAANLPLVINIIIAFNLTFVNTPSYPAHLVCYLYNFTEQRVIN